MLKKIPIKQLRLGMFIQELGGRWMDHPFWRASFKLIKPEDLQALVESGVPDLVIDTDKGLDVETGIKAVTPTPKPEAEQITSPSTAPQVPFEREVERAKQIQAKAKLAITSLFHEARMGQAISVENVAPLVDEINQSIERNSGALLSIVRLKTKDDYTYMHSVAVCGLMLALGRQMGLEGETLRLAGLGGLLHDLGKMAVPLDVLNKPGKLTDDEFTVIRTHPRKGWEVLKQANFTDEISLDIVLHHHERVDGKGYPEKISGDELTRFARMGAVCDVYDAITSDRPYKKGWAPGESIKRMAEWQGGQFDEKIFQAFVKTIGIYPTGTFVRLKSGRLGVVTDQSEKSLLTPKVKVFFSTKSNGPIKMEVIDLSRSQDSIESLEDVATWGFDLKKVMGF